MSDAAAAEAKMIENLKATSGRGIEEWVKIAGAAGLSKHGEIVAHLKADHGLGHGYANLVVHRLLKSAASDADAGDLIASQYSGAKTGLRPVYDALAGALAGHTGSVNTVAWSGDGAEVLTGSSDASARVWNATTGECVAVLKAAKDAPGGRFLYILDPGGEGALLREKPFESTIWHLDWSPDSSRLAVGAWNGEIVFFEGGR